MAEYLDRDDVLNVIDYIRTKYISVYNRRDKCSQFWADTIRYFEKRINKLDDIINNTPVADVAPIRHGHWIEEYDCGYITPHCSECGETALTKEETSYDYVYSSYCPRCGAKMGKTE